MPKHACLQNFHVLKDWDNLIGASLLLYAKTCMFTKLPCFIEVSFSRFKHTTNSYLIHTDLKKLITSIFDSNKNKQFFPKCALAFHVVVFLTDFKTFRMLNIYLKCDYLFPMCVCPSSFGSLAPVKRQSFLDIGNLWGVHCVSDYPLNSLGS